MSAPGAIASPQEPLPTLAMAPPPSPGTQPGSRGGDRVVPSERGEPDGTRDDAVSVEKTTSTGAAFVVFRPRRACPRGVSDRCNDRCLDRWHRVESGR
jgi:hypothetical protein